LNENYFLRKERNWGMDNATRPGEPVEDPVEDLLINFTPVFAGGEIEKYLWYCSK
jgi:hypothetical protein